jgi:hypothetical protein
VKRWLGVHRFAQTIHARNPRIDKQSFAASVASHYGLTKSRSVYGADDFAIRFCYSNDAGFSNCVVSLATLAKFDDRPFLVMLFQPSGVRTFLANSTFIRKVSHSSHKLTLGNVRGTILGHDIAREFDGITNEPSNFAALFEVHRDFEWRENLARIVAATTSISPTGLRFEPTAEELRRILESPTVSLSAERQGRIAKIEQLLSQQLKAHEKEEVRRMN